MVLSGPARRPFTCAAPRWGERGRSGASSSSGRASPSFEGGLCLLAPGTGYDRDKVAPGPAIKPIPHLRVVADVARHPANAPPAPSDDELIDAVVRGDDRVAGLLYDRVIGVVD